MIQLAAVGLLLPQGVVFVVAEGARFQGAPEDWITVAEYQEMKRKKKIKCDWCDGTGQVEYYPEYSGEAFDGAGGVVDGEMGDCPDCEGKGYYYARGTKATAGATGCADYEARELFDNEEVPVIR